MKRRIGYIRAIALLLTLGAGPVQAEGLLYDCDMRDIERGRGWVSPKIALVVPGDGSVTVVDAITLLFTGSTVPGTLVRDDAKRLIVKWSVPDVRADNGRSFAHFDYRASLAKSTGLLDLTAGPRSSERGFRSRGNCRPRRG